MFSDPPDTDFFCRWILVFVLWELWLFLEAWGQSYLDSLPARFLFCQEYVLGQVFVALTEKSPSKFHLYFNTLKTVNSIYFTTFFFFIKYKNLDYPYYQDILHYHCPKQCKGICFCPISLFLHTHSCITHTSYPQFHPYLYLSKKAQTCCSGLFSPVNNCWTDQITWLSIFPSALMSWHFYSKYLSLISLPPSLQSAEKTASSQSSLPALLLLSPVHLPPLLCSFRQRYVNVYLIFLLLY